MKPRRSAGSSLLHFAVFHDDVDLVKKLIEKGADPEHKNGEGDSPLDDARERASGVALSSLPRRRGRRRYECEAILEVLEAEVKRRAPPEPEPEVTKEEREAALARKHKISSNKLKEPNRKTWQEKMEESKKLQERRRGHELGLMPWEIDRAERLGIKPEDFNDIGQYDGPNGYGT